MATFNVCLPITGIIWVTVEAEDEDDAIDEALGSDQLETSNIAEWEALRRICSGNVLHAQLNEAYAVEEEE
jgi:hypothetical protein